MLTYTGQTARIYAESYNPPPMPVLDLRPAERRAEIAIAAARRRADQADAQATVEHWLAEGLTLGKMLRQLAGKRRPEAFGLRAWRQARRMDVLLEIARQQQTLRAP